MELPLDLHRYQATKWYVKSIDTDRQKTMMKTHNDIPLPGKILICGPPNAAVD